MKPGTVKLSAVILLAILIASCQPKKKDGYMMKVEPFGEFGGKEIVLITLTNTSGNTIKLSNYGATLVWVEVPDRDGKLENITFGYNSLEEYVNGDPYFGSVVGRYANRIAEGRFSLDDKEYNLTINNDPNTLHGGPGGWHSVAWDFEIDESDLGPIVKFSYYSPDMEEGYPGNMNVEVSYVWTENNEVMIEYNCSTDKRTVLNITNHAYFNLHGAGNGDILDHELMIRAASFTPVDENLIPTGVKRDVSGTPFDFREPFVIGVRIDEDYDQLALGRGYDHNFVLDNNVDVDAMVYDPSTGRMIEMMTNQPGVQLYCGNFLDGTQTGHGGKVYHHRSGLCLETQHFPDSPNQDTFPSCMLEPGKPFRSQTIYRFKVK